MTKTEELLALADLLMEDAPPPPELCDCNTCKSAAALREYASLLDQIGRGTDMSTERKALELAVQAMRAPLDDWKGELERKALDAARAALAQPAVPVDMVLYCPACGLQHLDMPEAHPDRPAWSNPPHRSHLCSRCGHIWRPADVPTNGVAVQGEPLPMAVEVRGMLSNGVEIPLAVRGVYALRDGKTGVFVHMPDADEQPPRQPLSDERIDAIPFMFNLTFGEADGQDEEEMAVALRKFARAVLAAAQEPTP